MVETLFLLLAARLALRLLPFRWLIYWCQRPVRRPELTGEARHAVVTKVRASIHFTNLWLDLNAACFPRCLAAQTMLRRRGVSTTLYYGAATLPDQQKLVTHVWLQDGEEGIVAHENSAHFQILARYSPLSATSTQA